MWSILWQYWPIVGALAAVALLAGLAFVWLAVLLARQLHEEQRAGILRSLDGQILYIPSGPGRPAYFRRLR